MAAKVTEESENEGHHCVMNLLHVLAEPVYGSAWLSDLCISVKNFLRRRNLSCETLEFYQERTSTAKWPDNIERAQVGYTCACSTR
jgi:hypothetical protein